MQVDFGKTSEDYARHWAGFPPSLFQRLATAGIGLPGQRVLDLGTGTGTLARGFALQGCHVTGVDVAAPQLAQAAELDRQAGVQVSYLLAAAEATGLPSAHFDAALVAALSSQFPADPLSVPHRIFALTCHTPALTEVT
ncbi:MAG: class I SAM-dependent methyltransferase [Anaerolinea sp.]|nr:class I SAM-dependent methyltransferase [Anaerolinea sp.]